MPCAATGIPPSPLLVMFIAYWLLGLPAGHLLARGLELGAQGYWWGLLIGLSSGALLLLFRLHLISRPPGRGRHRGPGSQKMA